MVGRFKLPAPGTVIGTIALVLAMGGAAYAGGGFGNSIGTGELKDGAVTAPKLHSDSVTSAKIRNNAVKGRQVNEGSLGTVPSAFKALNVLGAVVANDGALVRAQQANTTSSKTADGSYLVDFGTTVDACTFVGSLGGAGGTPSGEISTATATANAVQVQTTNSNGNAADRAFSLVVVC